MKWVRCRGRPGETPVAADPGLEAGQIGDRDDQAPPGTSHSRARATVARGSAVCSSACQITTASSLRASTAALSALALVTFAPILAAASQARGDGSIPRALKPAEASRATKRPSPAPTSSTLPLGHRGDEAQAVALGQPPQGSSSGAKARRSLEYVPASYSAPG